MELPQPKDDGMDDMPPMPMMPPAPAPMPSAPADGGMGDPMGGGPMGDDAGMGDEVSPKKSIQQQCGKLTSDMRNYLDTADPEDANELSLWVLQMVNKAGAPVLNNKGKKKVIDAIKNDGEEDFDGLDDENGDMGGQGMDANGLDPNAQMAGDAGMGDGMM